MIHGGKASNELAMAKKTFPETSEVKTSPIETFPETSGDSPIETLLETSQAAEISQVKAAQARKSSEAPKFIFVTGGVVSSIGKGLTAASLGTLLEARGFKVTLMKCDPYINVDPGTMSPFQHGEVYVTEDGAETDLDLGHYERFTQVLVNHSNSITTGQIYESVISRERRGGYLGGTVQVIPHITDEIKQCIHHVVGDADVIIVEIGGTVGDIEGLPFIEAIRQMRVDVGLQNSIFVHVTYLPYISSAGELKSKPTQHSVKELREVGIQPDFLICRSEKLIHKNIKSKISLFCSVCPEHVIAAVDSETIYEVPLAFHDEELDKKVCCRLGLELRVPNLLGWKDMVLRLKSPLREISIGIVGKYVDLKESYKSLHEAMDHGGIANHSRVQFVYIDSSYLTDENVKKFLSHLDGVLVPGGFGTRGTKGKLAAIRYVRENKIPFLGICLGMQLASIEFARNVCGIQDATSREFLDVEDLQGNTHQDFVIDFMEEQKSMDKMGGTMRLGAYSCHLTEGSHVLKIYGYSPIRERHRHRYEFNNKFKSLFESHGMTLSGICRERELVEVIEIKNHPWFIGVQFHPEFKSKPMEPHPLFASFVQAALERSTSRLNVKSNVKSTEKEIGTYD